MRILHLLAGRGWGGAERMGCTLHQLARAHGHESRIDAPALPELVQGVRTTLGEDLHGADEAATWRWALRARERRQRFRPDVVHAHLATPSLASAAWWIAGRTPLALTFHLLPSARWPADYLLRLPSPLVLETLRRAGNAVFVVVSRADREPLQRRFAHARIALTPNVPSPQPTAAAPAAQLRYPQGALRLLSVGRLVEQKGFERLLPVLAQPALRALPWHWLIVGDGPARGMLEASIASYGLQERVQLLGTLPSHGLYEQAELILCPSRFEGAPLVPLEAMRAAVPVLLSDIPAHRDLMAGEHEALLPEREAGWPEHLAALLGSQPARAELLRRQRARPLDDEASLWNACEAVYAQLLQA